MINTDLVIFPLTPWCDSPLLPGAIPLTPWCDNPLLPGAITPYSVLYAYAHARNGAPDTRCATARIAPMPDDT